jgi:APA family basic amino acid/polyamine antiporter
MGFWRTWSMTVGVMIGSGVFLLPAVLAPYGSLSFLGWCLTGGGSILLALTLGHLAARTKGVGGPYAYARDAFGDLTGFLVGWGYWISIVTAIAAIAVAFAGYLAPLFPVFERHVGLQAAAALAVIWVCTAINVSGVSMGGLTQLVMTLLKLVPLVVIIGLALVAGEPENVPAFNPGDRPVLGALAATALLTMWAFAGLEAGAVAADDVVDAQRTIPRAVVIGTITVTIVYIAATAAVMSLTPMEALAQSTSPFAEAARALGAWGPPFIALGALVSTSGCVNGHVLLAGQIPMALALDGLLPRRWAKRNRRGAPQGPLILSAALASLFLVFNYAEGLVAAFTFLIMMSTLTLLAPLAVAALADIRHSWRRSRAWAAIGVLALAYSAFAIVGSGFEVIAWGLVLMAIGAPLYYLARARLAAEPSAS